MSKRRMSKRLIIIEHCKGCPHATNSFATDSGKTTVGVLTGGAFLACVRTLKHCPDDGIPDWCPLPETIGYIEPAGNLTSLEDDE